MLVFFVIAASLVSLVTSKLVVGASLPSCDGCYSGQDGVYYKCCSDLSIYNGVCTCNGGPCTQCSRSIHDKQKVLPLSPFKKPSVPLAAALPSCNCGDISFKGAHYTCCGSMNLDGNGCTCDGAPCTQCSSNVPFKPMVLDSCSCYTMQMHKVYYSCCGTMSTNNNVCTCDGSPCTPCSPSAGK
jgi:hypothetical protein